MKLSVWDFIISEQLFSNDMIFFRWVIFKKSCKRAWKAELPTIHWESWQTTSLAQYSAYNSLTSVSQTSVNMLRASSLRLRGGGDVALVTAISTNQNRCCDPLGLWVTKFFSEQHLQMFNSRVACAESTLDGYCNIYTLLSVSVWRFEGCRVHHGHQFYLQWRKWPLTAQTTQYYHGWHGDKLIYHSTLVLPPCLQDRGMPNKWRTHTQLL